MTCDAKIRPFRPVNETEVQCEMTGPHTGMHEAVIRDYAYPGSQTALKWADDDRRTFRGTWTACPANCVLPDGHRGNHAP